MVSYQPPSINKQSGFHSIYHSTAADVFSVVDGSRMDGKLIIDRIDLIGAAITALRCRCVDNNEL